MKKELYEGDPMQQFYDKQKDVHSKAACAIWIIVGLFLFIKNGHLISLNSLIFFVGGLFTGALVLAMLNYYLQKCTAKVLLKSDIFSIVIIKRISLCLFFINTIISIYGSYMGYRFINWLL